VAAQGVPSDLKAAILLRALSYDRNLQRRSGAAVRVGIVHQAGQEGPGSCRATMSAAFRAATTQRIQDLPITVVELELRSIDQLQAEIDSEGVNLLYICEGLGGRADAIADLAASRALLTLCGSEELVREGLAIGVAPKGETAKIVVNVRAARGQGADLDSRLLMMAELVR
jgi:hypothetical protein